MHNKFRYWLTAGAVLSAAATAACNQPRFVDTPPPPPAYVDEKPTYADQPGDKPGFSEAPLPPPPAYRDGPGPRDLAEAPPPPPRRGPPPPRRDDGLAGGPPPPREPEFLKMQPVPNPEDLTPEERAKVYGPGEAAESKLAGGPKTKHPTARRGARHAAGAGKAGTHIATKSPAAKSSASAKPAQQAAVAPSATTKAAPKAAASAPAAGPLTKPQQLGAALAGEVTAGAQLDIPNAIREGNEGIVTLTLPPSLGERIRQEAAKLGLGSAARTAEARATLSGEGYDIDPSDPQNAALKDNESAGFTWIVKPQAGDKGPLSANVGANLTGGGKSQTLDISTLERPVSPEADKAGGAAKLSQRWVTFGLLGLLALFVIIALTRSNGRREETERRRRARAAASLGEYGDAEVHSTEKPKS